MIIELLAAAVLNLTPLPAPKTEIVSEPINGTIIKPTFKQRHPRVCKYGRKLRTVCIFVKPVADVAMDVAVIVFR